jgi:hypothetical protein
VQQGHLHVAVTKKAIHMNIDTSELFVSLSSRVARLGMAAASEWRGFIASALIHCQRPFGI